MKVKKYVANTLKEASQKMKQEMGEDAIILGTRIIEGDSKYGVRKMFEVTGGIEDDNFDDKKEEQIIKADFNREREEPESDADENDVFTQLEQLQKKIYRKRNPEKTKEVTLDKVSKKLKNEHDEFALHQEIDEIKATLEHREIQEHIVKSVVEYLNENFKHLTTENIDNYVVSNLSSMIPTRTFELDKKKKPYYVSFVGPTGVGKTTCLAKLATISKILHNLDVGIVSADTYRLGAIDQLKIFSEIIDIDLLVAYEAYEMEDIMKKFRKKDIVFIDTAGRSQHKPEQLQKTKEFLNEVPIDDTYLVMSATSTTKNLYDIAEKFKVYNYDAFVFTKVDESAAFGNILNLVTKFNNIPILYLTNGQVIPDDIISADSDFIANMIYSGKITT